MHALQAPPRHAAVNEVSCVKPLDGLGVCIVADAADRAFDPGLKQPFLICYRDTSAAPVAVMSQAAAMQAPPVKQSLLQRIKHEPLCAARLTSQPTIRRENASMMKAT